jgi:hypothetical protein
MALPDQALPYGLRDLELKQVTEGTGTLGALVDLPAARTLTFNEVVESADLRGDDTIVATHESAPSIEWELEAGGISFAAWAILAGGTVTESGVTPNIVRTFARSNQARPYFYCEGQVISDNGGDVHAVLYRCKSTGNVGGEFTDNEFFLTSCSGKGVVVPTGYTNAGKLYDLIQNETATAIA